MRRVMPRSGTELPLFVAIVVVVVRMYIVAPA